MYKCLLLLLALLSPHYVFGDSSGRACSDPLCNKVVRQIRVEASRENNDPLGNPFPLAAHWNTGEKDGGFNPEYQVGLIKKGHRIFPWMKMPIPSGKAIPIKNMPLEYYENSLLFFKENSLPVSFVSPQWERILTEDKRFKSLAPDSNPNVVTLDGKILDKVSPFSPVKPWREAGNMWATTSLLGLIQKIYPNPPKVMFISNNEHPKLNIDEVNISARYMSLYANLKDPEEIRRIFGDAWIERYSVLQKGMKDALVSESWKNNSSFVGYNAFGTRAFGRWSNWKKYSLYIKGRLEPWPLSWGGASVPYYVNNWDPGTDYNLFGPQIQGMNWVFMLEETYRYNPDFWFEISTWDGDAPGKENDKRNFYRELGQNYGPVRYEGMVQFGMWLLRPRVVREFRGHTRTVLESGVYFESVLRSVDRVYDIPVLRKFWRKGNVVANRAKKHPFQEAIPVEYKDKDRWFLLETNANPPRPWKLETKLNLFPLVLSYGEGDNKEWLLYLFSPTPIKNAVQIAIPGYGNVTIENVPTWGFYHLDLKNGLMKVLSGRQEICEY